MERVDNLIEVNVVNGKLEITQPDTGFSESDDLIAAVIDGVMMVGTREMIADKILESFRKGFAEDGVTTEDLIQAGEKIREELYEETYGNKAK